MQDEVYTVQEIAQKMKVSERTVRNWIEKEGLPAFPIGKRGYRVVKVDLDAWVEARKQSRQAGNRSDNAGL
jgi:excisionase family DNA binding protein